MSVKRNRPSIIEGIDLNTDTPSNVVEMPSPPQVRPAKERAARPDVQHTSVYIPRQAYERIREIAYTERRKIHDLIMEGLDRVIAERGHSERATKSTTALQRHDTTE